jgi:hypothetical protein
MNPLVWGNHVWKSIHYIALGYPENASEIDKEAYFSYYTNLYKVLPCDECATHLKQLVEQHPITISELRNRRSLFDWTVKIHNEVNKTLKKKTMTADEAFILYTNHNNEVVRKTTPQNKTQNIIISSDQHTDRYKDSNICSSKIVLYTTIIFLVIILCSFIIAYFICNNKP